MRQSGIQRSWNANYGARNELLDAAGFAGILARRSVEGAEMGREQPKPEKDLSHPSRIQRLLDWMFWQLLMKNDASRRG